MDRIIVNDSFFTSRATRLHLLSTIKTKRIDAAKVLIDLNRKPSWWTIPSSRGHSCRTSSSASWLNHLWFQAVLAPSPGGLLDVDFPKDLFVTCRALFGGPRAFSKRLVFYMQSVVRRPCAAQGGNVFVVFFHRNPCFVDLHVVLRLIGF